MRDCQLREYVASASPLVLSTLAPDAYVRAWRYENVLL